MSQKVGDLFLVRPPIGIVKDQKWLQFTNKHRFELN